MNKDKNKKQVGSMDYRKALNEAKFEGNKQGRPSKINNIIHRANKFKRK